MPADRPEHVPLKVWQERHGEISWRCSCGAANKHHPLPAGEGLDLTCAFERSPEFMAEAEAIAAKLPANPDFSEEWVAALVDNFSRFED